MKIKPILKRTFLCVLSFAAILGYAQNSSKAFIKGVEQYQKSNYSGALKNFSKALEENPECEDCYVYKALCCFALKKYQEVYDVTTVGIKKFPGKGELYCYRGSIMHATGDMYAALDDANMAVKYAKADTTILNSYILRIGVKLELRNFDGAMEDCKIALKRDSLHKGILTNMSLIYSEQGKIDESIDLMKKVLTIDSTYIEGIGNLGYLLNLKGEYAEAKKYLEIGIRKKSPGILPYLLSNRGYSNLKLGDPKAALKDVNESIALLPQNSYAYRNLGLIYLETKEEEKACEAFNTAIQKGFTETYGEEVKTLIKENCKK